MRSSPSCRRRVGAGGPFDELQRRSVRLGLSDDVPGETDLVLVHGDTGLGSDPSTFAALPVLVPEAILPTR